MTWIAKQQFEKTELGVREVDALTTARDLTAIGIDHELAETKHALASGKFAAFNNRITPADATQNCRNAGFELFGAERLGEVIVGPQVEASDALGNRFDS